MLLSESILRVFARLLDGNPWLRALETEDLLYDAIHTRIEYGILFTKMIQEQCELRPALPHMEKNLRVHLETDMKSHMEQHRMCIESNSKQSEEMCKRFEERSVDRAKQLDKSLDLMEVTQLLQLLLTISTTIYLSQIVPLHIAKQTRTFSDGYSHQN